MENVINIPLNLSQGCCPVCNHNIEDHLLYDSLGESLFAVNDTTLCWQIYILTQGANKYDYCYCSYYTDVYSTGN